VELERSRSALRTLSRLPAFGAVQRVADSLAWSSRRPGRLLVLGTPGYEPWHLVAHLQTSALAPSAPMLLRWSVPVGAPAHLALGLDRLADCSPADTVLVVAGDQPNEELLNRLDDARRHGNTVLGLATGQPAELDQVTHELAVVRGEHFDHAQHYLPVARARSRFDRNR
jgi:hypothetical protein